MLRKVLFPIARRFVAGETEESALARARELNEKGVTAMIDHLGEHVQERGVVDDAVREYDELLGMMNHRDLDACISVKPTHLGLEIGYGLCMDSLKYLARRAKYLDRFLWIDMESSHHTDETIELYKQLLKDYDNVGLCIQCYLKRSEEDVRELVEEGGIIRLVKGAYSEPRSKAFRDKSDVDENFRRMAEILFEGADYFAIGTHDLELVEYAKELMREHDRKKDEFEFQFLMGIRDETKEELAADGFNVAEYVPYGSEWVSYHWRRVMERKENLWFALKAVFRG